MERTGDLVSRQFFPEPAFKDAVWKLDGEGCTAQVRQLICRGFLEWVPGTESRPQVRMTKAGAIALARAKS